MAAPDFGWRLHGRVTTVLPDRSFDLAEPEQRSSFARRHLHDVSSLQACLQCGTCTATCDLASDDTMFPRRQLTFVRLGLEGRAAGDPEIWKCYACADCTAKCPSGAEPAGIMRGLRQLAIERFAYPRPLAEAVNEPKGILAVYALVAALLAGLIALGGAVPALAPSTMPGCSPGPCSSRSSRSCRSCLSLLSPSVPQGPGTAGSAPRFGRCGPASCGMPFAGLLPR